MALNSSLARLSQETLPSVLFPQPPVVRFAPERDTCHCGESLLVQKTRRKTVLSMIGPFIAHETVLNVLLAPAPFIPTRCSGWLRVAAMLPMMSWSSWGRHCFDGIATHRKSVPS